MDNELEIELNFTDITMAETDGVFKEVESIMLSEYPHSKKWVIRTEATIESKFGMGIMILNCFHDRNIYILEYEPSIGDVFYNPDVQSLTRWSQENGWNIPQPQESLIKSNREFWKHFYDTLIIDSDYFDKTYGKRIQIEGIDE
ncbi:hypothetical protein LCGC14_2165080 [marine sediment metagenome]|uniref:Uncharacterized protein n=1 Tax=marine sediment metagenome TaxID=412755 RepID=A0A0F9G4E9_9ZZZZ